MHNEKQLFLIREWRVDLRGRLPKKCAKLVPPGQCGNPTLLYKRYHHTSYFLLTNKQQSTNVMAKSQYGNMTKHDKSRNTRNTLSLSHSLTLSLSHAEQLLFSCLCSKVTLPLSHSFNLDMLNRASVVTNRIEKKNIYKLNFKQGPQAPVARRASYRAKRE